MCEAAWYSSSERKMHVTHSTQGQTMLFTFLSESGLNINARTKRPILRRTLCVLLPRSKIKNERHTHGTWGTSTTLLSQSTLRRIDVHLTKYWNRSTSLVCFCLVQAFLKPKVASRECSNGSTSEYNWPISQMSLARLTRQTGSKRMY